MDRRDVLRTFGAIAAVGCCGRVHAQPLNGGCSLSAAAADNFSNSVALLSTCGVSLIDAAMPGEISILKGLFGVSPDFAFYDDSGGPNARASSENIVGSSSDGSVIFGVELLQSELTQPWWGAAIAGISAHEWAHIVQFQSGISGPTWKRELHADFMAGWYLGNKALAGTFVVIDGLGTSLFSKGSYQFNHPDFHGTPSQRVNSMIAGYNQGKGGVTVGNSFSWSRSYFGI